MISEYVFIAIILGFTGGLIPGPIIILAFSEIIKSPKNGLVNGAKYIVFAGLTEFLIGFFLVATSSLIIIPVVILHIITIIGILMLFYIGYQVYRIRKIEYNSTAKKIGIVHIVVLMLLNGPLWLFWISVCVPAALKLGDLINFGEYLFIIIFEISMMFGLAIILFGFNSFRNLLTKEKIIGRIFSILSAALFFIALRILYSEIISLIEFIK
jgi:threonine/homoserine/homoserine lactone efflux protein